MLAALGLAFAVTLVLVVHLLLRSHAKQAEQWQEQRHELQLVHQREAEHWVQERRELLNRIQRPEYVPMNPAVGWVAPEQESDEMALVGTINYPDDDEGQPRMSVR